MIDLEAKIKELEEQYSKLTETIEAKEQQYREELYTMNEELLRLQGEYRLAKSILNTENKTNDEHNNENEK